MSCKLIQRNSLEMNRSNFHSKKNVSPKTVNRRESTKDVKKAKTTSISISTIQIYKLL